MAVTLADMIKQIPPDWRAILAAPLAEDWFAEVGAFVVRERAEHSVYPPAADVFAALRLTPFDSVRAVILGQDPYHQPGRAHGLAFSVPPGVKLPGSLRNILAEWARDLGRPIPTGGSLVPWAQHGVLLLNTVLTVRRGEPRSHVNQRWERFTEAVVATVAAKPDTVVFLLWGAHAQRFRSLINETRHVVLDASHPSPLSARRPCGDAPPFLGSAPFRRANEELARRGQPPIDWELALY
jgi:uracil-DNA glycosylase